MAQPYAIFELGGKVGLCRATSAGTGRGVETIIPASRRRARAIAQADPRPRAVLVDRAAKRHHGQPARGVDDSLALQGGRV